MKKLILILALVGMGCAVDILRPADPQYEQECIIYASYGDTLLVHRSTWEHCDPVKILITP